MTDIESLSASLVREYLSRKTEFDKSENEKNEGLRRSLRVLDDEFPRHEDSIRNRVILAKELKIEKLIRSNKEQEDSFRTMIEIMVKYFIEAKRSPRHQAVNGDRTEQLVKRRSSLNDSRKDNASNHSFDLDQQQDAALRFPKENGDVLTKEAGTVMLKQAKSVESFGLDGDQLSSNQINSRGSLKSLTSSGSKVKNQGRIQRTAEKSRKSRPKKDSDVNSNGFLFNDLEDDALYTATEQRRQKDHLQQTPQTKILSKTDNSQTERRTSRNLKTDDKHQLHKRPRAMEKEKAVSDVLMFDDIENELSDDFDYMNLGLPTKRLISKLYENSAAINMETAINLKKIVFGSSSMSFNQEWKCQSFSFCDLPDLGYGIVQIKGGPCGILAAVQATVLKHLIFSGDQNTQWKRPPDPSPKERTNALIESTTEILWRAGGKKTSSVCISSGKSKFVGGGRYKSDGLTETLTIYEFGDRDNLKAFISQNIGQFESESGSGCILLLYSLVFSRTIKRIKSDMDEVNGTLIGSHGYCTQELVNLCLTGKAVSNVFDGVMELDSGGTTKSMLNGIEKQSDIGFLSLFEHYDSCKVGDNYKNPTYPIWVVCSESHFSTLFSINGRLLLDRRFQKQFDLYYYDGLARQDEEIRLSIDTQGSVVADADDLIPPLEHCIRTKWKNASVDWNNTEPLL